MTREEVQTVLRANIGQRLHITFDDNVVWSTDITSVDDEGFLHSGPDGTEPDGYWTRFEGVLLIEPPA